MATKRLTQSMRQFLDCLAKGEKPRLIGLTGSDGWAAASSVGTALRKRGFVTQAGDLTYSITPQGKAALDAHNRGIQ